MKLWDHQAKAVALARNRSDFAFLFEPGCGKTLACLATIGEVFCCNNVSILPTLIIAPVIVLENWKEEIAKYTNIPKERVCVLHGSTKSRIDLLSLYKKNYGQGFIAITNYEGLVSSRPFFSEIEKWSPKILVIDESQRIKTHNSKRTKLVTALADKAQYRYLLTGTPILNTPLDIYSQFRALDGGSSFGKNFYFFRAKYFYDRNANMPKQHYFPDWKIRPESYDAINKVIYSKAMRIKKEECLDLPPLVKQRIYVELSPKQKQLYEEMKKHFLTTIDNSVIAADNALTKTLRLLQIVSGFIYDGEKNYSLDTPRQNALKELLELITPTAKTLVWCAFRENYEQVRSICNKLKIGYVEAHGEVSHKKKYQAVEDFNTNSEIRVFIGHPASLGIGINLVAASYNIYYSKTFSLEYDIQSEARCYRGGSEIHDKITRIDLVAKDTIDEIVMEVLDKKIISAEKILGLLKEKI